MRIISYNVNGIRAAIKKGLVEWLQTDPADIICIQETKAEKDNVDMEAINQLGYQDYWFSAKKKGYSGVAVFTKIKPDHVEYGTGHPVSDEEGRVIQLDCVLPLKSFLKFPKPGNTRRGKISELLILTCWVCMRFPFLKIPPSSTP